MERDEVLHVCLTEDGVWAACPARLCEARELLRGDEELALLLALLALLLLLLLLSLLRRRLYRST